MTYRLDVITRSVIEAVRHAGGLMFDLGRAGWRVRVVTDHDAHVRALAILGTHIQAPGPRDHEVHEPDRVIRAVALPTDQLPNGLEDLTVDHLLTDSRAQLLFWGQHVGDDLPPVLPVRHELSPAARIFKTHAMHSLGLDIVVDSSEQFWYRRILEPDLFGRLLDQQRLYAGMPRDVSARRAPAPSPSLVGGYPHG